MTRAEGAAIDRLARGESVPGGPGACARPGCGHGKIWHSHSNRQHPCEQCDCPAYQPPAGFEVAEHIPADVAAELALAEDCPQRATYATLPRWTRYVYDQRGTRRAAVLEDSWTDGANVHGTEVGPEHEWLGPVTIPEDTIKRRVEITREYFLVNVTGAAEPTPCICHSCGGQCGGNPAPGWCGPTVTVDGREICQVCREEADVFTEDRTAVAVRSDDGADHVRMVVDPFNTLHKLTARLSPADAVHLGMLLIERGAELQIGLDSSGPDLAGQQVRRLDDDRDVPHVGTIMEAIGARPGYVLVLWEDADLAQWEALDELTGAAR